MASTYIHIRLYLCTFVFRGTIAKVPFTRNSSSSVELETGFRFLFMLHSQPKPNKKNNNVKELGFPRIGIQAYSSAINSQCRTHFAALFRYISERHRDALGCSTYKSQSRLNEISHNSQFKALLKLAGVEKAAFVVNVGRVFCTHLHTLSLSRCLLLSPFCCNVNAALRR